MVTVGKTFNLYQVFGISFNMFPVTSLDHAATQNAASAASAASTYVKLTVAMMLFATQQSLLDCHLIA